MVRELPKLTALTLTSAIGGGGGTGGGGSTVFGLLLAAGFVLGLGACSADRDLGGEPSAPEPAASQLLSCTADRVALTLSCRAPEAAPGTVVLGNQGTVVALRSSGVSYSSGTGILSANVTVQNLGAGPIGTTDGTTPSGNGIRVFFVTPPSASPTGTVTVNNETGTATFTASGQEYFEYPGMLATQATSAPLTWEFLFAGGATDFTFSVMLSTEVPAAGAVMRWATEIGFGAINWTAVRGWGADGLALYGAGAEVMVRDGGAWRARHDPLGRDPTSPIWVGAPGPQELYSFVNNSGTNQIRQWDGISWRDLLAFGGAPSPDFLVSKLVVRGQNDLFAYGFRFYQFNGTSWSNKGVPNSPTNDRLLAATVLNGKILGVDKDGGVWQWNDTSWTKVVATNSGQNRNPTMILASDLNHIWIFDNGFPYTEVRYWDGSSWTSPALPHTLGEGYEAKAGAVLSPTDVYLIAGDGAGFGYVWHWDGSSWTQIRSVTGRGYNDIWARSASEIYLAGSNGWVDVGDGAGNWTTLIQPTGGGTTSGVRVINSADIYLGTSAGKIVHYNGTAWSEVANIGGDVASIWAFNSSSVWATRFSNQVAHFNGASWDMVSVPTFAYAIGGWAPGDLWTVGANGGVSHYNGTTWSLSVAEDGALGSETYNAVWAADANFAVAVGQSGVIGQWNGSSWSPATSPTGAGLRAVSGTSNTDAWAVGDGGTAVHWNGTDWTTSNIGTGATLNGVWAASPTEVYAVSQGGTVHLYNGSSWSVVSLPPLGGGQNFSSVHGTPTGRVFITGSRVLRGTR
jgi:hypothetical protein